MPAAGNLRAYGRLRDADRSPAGDRCGPPRRRQ